MPNDETIQDAGAALSNAERVGNWVKDGTPAAEPVTTETPAAETAEEQQRGPDGRFLPKGSEPIRPADTPASATPTPASSASATPSAVPAAPAPGASAAEVQEFIEAQLGEGTFQVPKGVKIPLKRGDTIEYATIEELQKRGMLELDYRHKTAERAREKRENEAIQTRLAATEARVQAREQWLAEREAEMREAQKDPEKWEAYQDLQRLYQSNPQFRKVMDDALAKRETDAELAVYQGRDYQAQVQEGVELATSWIDQFASEFADVNPERVRVRYAEALSAGRARLDPEFVRGIYEDEARYVTSTTSPLQQQLADLKARLAAIEDAKGAEKHNATTAHALSRAKAPPVAASGRPPAPAGAPATSRFGMNELVERNQAWANQRD